MEDGEIDDGFHEIITTPIIEEEWNSCRKIHFDKIADALNIADIGEDDILVKVQTIDGEFGTKKEFKTAIKAHNYKMISFETTFPVMDRASHAHNEKRFGFELRAALQLLIMQKVENIISVESTNLGDPEPWLSDFRVTIKYR